MIPYILFILGCFLLSIIYDGKEEKSATERTLFWCACAYLICLSGFSYRLGGDKVTYIALFEEIYLGETLTEYMQYQFTSMSFMPLWSILNYLVKQWTDSFYVIQFIVSGFINIVVGYIVLKYSKRHFLVLLLYFVSGIFFHFNTEVMRESFAIGFGLLAIDQYFTGKKWLFGVLVACAIGFHISGCLLLLFPFTRFKIHFHGLIVLMLVASSLWFFGEVVLTKLLVYLPSFSEGLCSKIIYYISSGTTIFGFAQLVLRFIVIPYLIGYICFQGGEDNKERIDQLTHLQTFILLIGVFISCLGFNFMRFANYPRIFYLCMLAESLYLIFHGSKQFIIGMFCWVFLVLFNVLQWITYYPETNSHFYDLFVPYTSCFYEEKIAEQRIYIYEEACPTKEDAKGQRDIQY